MGTQLKLFWLTSDGYEVHRTYGESEERERERKRKWDKDGYLRAVNPGRGGPNGKVTPREIERMVRMRQMGYTVREIVDVTGLSKGTVSRYTSHVCRD